MKEVKIFFHLEFFLRLFIVTWACIVHMQCRCSAAAVHLARAKPHLDATTHHQSLHLHAYSTTQSCHTFHHHKYRRVISRSFSSYFIIKSTLYYLIVLSMTPRGTWHHVSRISPASPKNVSVRLSGPHSRLSLPVLATAWGVCLPPDCDCPDFLLFNLNTGVSAAAAKKNENKTTPPSVKKFNHLNIRRLSLHSKSSSSDDPNLHQPATASHTTRTHTSDSDSRARTLRPL